MKFSVPKMNCGHCRAAITEAVIGLDPSAQVAVDLPSRTVEVGTGRSPGEVQAAIREAGYESAPA